MSPLETYLTYSALAQVAYIDISKTAIGSSWDGTATIRRETIIDAGRNQIRVPEALGRQLFADGEWNMLSPYYRTGSLTGHSDPDTGFAGMLLSHPTIGKALAIAGTQPTDNVQAYFDLLDADVRQIGSWGVAFKQLVSLYNYVQVLQAPVGATKVRRLEVRETAFAPPDGVKFIKNGAYIWVVEHRDGIGQGQLVAGDRLTVTGHSLGGHLAAAAVALMPDVFDTAYTFNAPGYDPVSSWVAGGADAMLATLLGPYLEKPPLSVSAIAGRVRTLEAEDAIPGDDREIVASSGTGKAFSPEEYIVTEKVTHDIGHLTGC